MSRIGKRKFGPPAVMSNHPNVTPLIDVVMCLIIFYMLVAKIGIATGADESIVVPASLVGGDIRDFGNTLTLNVKTNVASGEPMVSALVGGHVTDLAVRDAAGGAPLRDALRQIRFGRDGQANTPDDNPDFKVIIRADENAPYTAVEPVLMACAEAAVRNVAFNTRKLDGSLNGGLQ
jgi:biopolymer transport protein ExbD